MRTKPALWSGGLLLLTGCATFQEGAGFDEVRTLVGSRLHGKEVVWETGSEADKNAEERVHAILRDELSVDGAVQVALLKNPTLQATYQNLGVAQADVVQAGLLSNPVLTVERRFPKQALEVDVAQNFLDFFLLPLRSRIAAQAFQAARLEVSQAVLEHAFHTRSAFYTYQASLQLLDMRRSVVSATEASLEAARGQHQAGNIAVLKLQQEQALAVQAQLELAAAEAEAVEAREKLNVLMGLWGKDTHWRIVARLPDPPAAEHLPERLESVAVSQRPDLQAMRHEIEAQGRAVGLTRIEALIPELSVSSHYEREPEGEETTGPSIDLPLPIFNFGQGAVGLARARLEQTRRHYAALAIQIRSEVRASLAKMNLSRKRAQYFKDHLLPLQQTVVEQSQLFYNGMFLGVFELLQAKQAQIDAGRGYIETIRDYWLARTELESALGQELKLEMTSPAEPVPAPANSSHHHHHH